MTSGSASVSFVAEILSSVGISDKKTNTYLLMRSAGHTRPT
jgi:hypothetical protein